MLCSAILQASLSPNSAHPSSLPRVRDWSTVVAFCHHSFSVWHQSLLAHVSCPLPDFPARASTLDSLFSSLTQVFFDSASLRSRRRPTVSRPRTRQPLWWNGVLRRSGSLEDRFRLIAVSQHSLFLQDPLLERVAWVCARRAPRLACSLIRRTFRSPTVIPDLCHMQWHGASRSALPPHEARSQWRPLFLPLWGLSVF